MDNWRKFREEIGQLINQGVPRATIARHLGVTKKVLTAWQLGTKKPNPDMASTAINKLAELKNIA